MFYSCSTLRTTDINIDRCTHATGACKCLAIGIVKYNDLDDRIIAPAPTTVTILFGLYAQNFFARS